jgi:integrase
MAVIEKRGIAWRARVRKAGIDRSESFPTKRAAQAWAAQFEATLNAERRGEIPVIPFADLIDRYAREITPTKKGARSESMRINRIKRLDISRVLLPDFDERAVSAWRDRRLQEVSSASVAREWVTLSHACNVAIREWHWLRDNPFTRAKRPDGGKARKRRPEGDEMESMLHVLGYHDGPLTTVNSRVAAAALFAVETAMRASEICGLTPQTIDFDRRVAHIAESKNGHARDVPLSREAIRIIHQLPAGYFDVSAASTSALWAKARTKAAVEGLRFHDLRREALTRLSKKLPVLELAKMSGHRDLSVLLNTYYAPDMGDLADKLD